MCRGNEVSEAKVILVSFFDNLADTISKVLARDRLVIIGILPSVNSTKKKKQDVKPVISVCSRIIRLTNNRTKSQRKATILTKEDKNAVAGVKIGPQLGCVSQDTESLDSQGGKLSR